jgi:hypothetical protein
MGLVDLTYLVKFLEAYYQRTWQNKVAEIGWKVSRFFIGPNRVRPLKISGFRTVRGGQDQTVGNVYIITVESAIEAFAKN